MKKWIVILVGVLFLTGCGSMETFETMGDISHVSSTKPVMQSVVLSLPENAVLEASDTDVGLTMYDCEGYTIYLQTFASGDIQSTLRTLTGFTPENLMVMESACSDHTRYDWVWTAVAEEGDMVCRGTVLDDGGYHYSLCVMAEAQTAGQYGGQWNALFSSFCLQA